MTDWIPIFRAENYCTEIANEAPISPSDCGAGLKIADITVSIRFSVSFFQGGFSVTSELSPASTPYLDQLYIVNVGAQAAFVGLCCLADYAATITNGLTFIYGGYLDSNLSLPWTGATAAVHVNPDPATIGVPCICGACCKTIRADFGVQFGSPPHEGSDNGILTEYKDCNWNGSWHFQDFGLASDTAALSLQRSGDYWYLKATFFPPFVGTTCTTTWRKAASGVCPPAGAYDRWDSLCFFGLPQTVTLCCGTAPCGTGCSGDCIDETTCATPCTNYRFDFSGGAGADFVEFDPMHSFAGVSCLSDSFVVNTFDDARLFQGPVTISGCEVRSDTGCQYKVRVVRAGSAYEWCGCAAPGGGPSLNPSDWTPVAGNAGNPLALSITSIAGIGC